MRGLILLAFLAGPVLAAGPDAATRSLIATQCAACHVVPGIPGAVGKVGPSLRGIARQRMIAGRLPNTPGNMARWLMHPQRIDPGNAMPNMGLTQDQADRIAAYLMKVEQR